MRITPADARKHFVFVAVVVHIGEVLQVIDDILHQCVVGFLRLREPPYLGLEQPQKACEIEVFGVPCGDLSADHGKGSGNEPGISLSNRVLRPLIQSNKCARCRSVRRATRRKWRPTINARLLMEPANTPTSGIDQYSPAEIADRALLALSRRATGGRSAVS